MSCSGAQKSGCCGQNQPQKAGSGCCDSGNVVHDQVKDYYGKRVKTGKDLQTNVCLLGATKRPEFFREALNQIHEEVKSKCYGCGLIAPEALEGCSILDLGSGAGMDCFVLSKLVGQDGNVTGLDMTDEQLEVANKYIDYHTKAFGYSKPNVNFVKGYIEKLTEAGLPENHFDIIVSNCVVNLSPDKKAVLQEAYKVLKPGGELYFSDVYADKVVTKEIREHEVLWGECIAGALWWKDLYCIAKEVGFSEPKLVSADLEEFNFKEKSELLKVVDGYRFLSANYRIFKLPPETKDHHAMTATYKGGILGAEDALVYDFKHTFQRDTPFPVNGEIAAEIKSSRFRAYFKMDPIDTQDAPKKACCPPDPFDLASKGQSKSSSCCS